MAGTGRSDPAVDMNALRGREWLFTAPEEVGAASIRKFALAIGDTNPLYYDKDYAGKSPYGGIIAPPTFVCETMQYFRGELGETGDPAQKPRLALGTEIRGGNEYQFFRPLRPEDVLSVRWKIVDVREREGKTGKLIILVSEITYSNQLNQTLAINKETTLFRISDSQTQDRDQSGPATTGESTSAPPDTVPGPERPLFFEDVEVGDDITALCKEITLARMVFYSAATWDFNRYHYDHDFAREKGFPGPVVDGQMLGAFVAQMLADWAGDPGSIGRIAFRFSGFVYPGDVLTSKGRVAGKSSEEGQNLVECELWVENQAGVVVLAPTDATLRLPSRVM